MKNFLKVEENHGCGTKKDLTTQQLASLQRVCDNFRKLAEANSDDYALYRCNLTCDGDIIYAVFSGADAKGNVKEAQFGYSTSKHEIYSRKISFKQERKVADSLYELLVNIMGLIPFSVGMLDFPIEGNFEKGFIMDYNKEPGTALIIVKDSLDNDFFLED